MLIYGLMKFVEQAPFHYEKFMNIMSLGKYAKTIDLITKEVNSNSKVLDVGCGTGRVSIICAKNGASTWAVDSSVQMLDILKERSKDLTDKLTIINCGSASMDKALGGEKFDVIIASFMLGELNDEIRFQTLTHMSNHLNEGGKIIINDELWPEKTLRSFIYYFLFAITFIPNFLLTRTVIRPVSNLKEDLEKLSLKIVEEINFSGGITMLKIIRKA